MLMAGPAMPTIGSSAAGSNNGDANKSKAEQIIRIVLDFVRFKVYLGSASSFIFSVHRRSTF